jgi:hypothetical protein
MVMKLIQVRLDEETHAKVLQSAVVCNRSVSNWVRTAILRSFGEGLEEFKGEWKVPKGEVVRDDTGVNVVGEKSEWFARLPERPDPMNDPKVQVLADKGLVFRGTMEVPLADGIRVSVGDNEDPYEGVDIHKIIIEAMNDTTEDSDVDFGQLNSGGRKRLKDAYVALKMAKATDEKFWELATECGLVAMKSNGPMSVGGVTFNSTRRAPDVKPVSKAEQTKGMKKSRKKGKK